MTTQRTGGMTTIGILNIIFGSLGTLLCLLMVLGGGLLAVGGAAMEAEMGAEAEGMGEMAATGGGLIMLMGLFGAVAWALLAVAGIGVLKCAAWGRTLSILCCGVIGLLCLVSLVFGDFSIFMLGMLAYTAVQIGLFMKSDWAAVFSGNVTQMMGMSEDATPVTSASPIPGGSAADSGMPAPHIMHGEEPGMKTDKDGDSMQSAA